MKKTALLGLISILMFCTINHEEPGEAVGYAEVIAETTAVICVDPPTIQVNVGQAFTINVTIADVSDLYGYEFTLFWNNTVLYCIEAVQTPPEIWTQELSVSPPPPPQQDYNSTHGRYLCAQAALSPDPPFNGTVSVVTLTFNATAYGESSLALRNTVIIDSHANTLSHEVVDGFVEAMASLNIPEPHHMIVATIVEPDTVDPAWAYDTPSQELIFNVYETLIFYDRESVDRFVPMLATEWHISEDGLSYTFKIRQGVEFQNGETLTTEDVEYSFERAMVHDALASPTWMIYEALRGCQHANISDPSWHLKIENAVKHNDTHVSFHLLESYAPFLQIVCQSWSSIVNKRFCVEHGDWPANETTGKWFWPGGNWTQYHNLENSPLDTGGDWMCGTGPYKFDYWGHGYFGEYSLVRFDDYWQGWPAPDCEGYVSRATVKFIPYWVKRKKMLLNRTADIISVPREYIEQLEGTPGIRCIKDLPTLVCNAFFFTLDVNTTSPYMGVPGGLPPGTINETGIPPDFFSDIHVRKGFAYSFNFTQYIEEVYLGEANQPATCVVKGLPHQNPHQERYDFNLTKAKEHFMRAWDSQVWEKGFTMDIVYNIGHEARELACEMIKSSVESLNPRFHVNVHGIEWRIYFDSWLNLELPLFMMGWPADYPDPHSFIHPFMHSSGTFAYFQGYSNATVDALVQEGLRTLNTTRRHELYYNLQGIYHDDCPSVPTVQPLARHWERDWVQGWYYNPMYPGIYFYHLWKQSAVDGDINNDGIVNIEDIAIIAKAFASYPGHPRWNEIADVDKNGVVNIIDVAKVAKEFGKTT